MFSYVYASLESLAMYVQAGVLKEVRKSVRDSQGYLQEREIECRWYRGATVYDRSTRRE